MSVWASAQIQEHIVHKTSEIYLSAAWLIAIAAVWRPQGGTAFPSFVIIEYSLNGKLNPVQGQQKIALVSGC